MIRSSMPINHAIQITISSFAEPLEPVFTSWIQLRYWLSGDHLSSEQLGCEKTESCWPLATLQILLLVVTLDELVTHRDYVTARR